MFCTFFFWNKMDKQHEHNTRVNIISGKNKKRPVWRRYAYLNAHTAPLSPTCTPPLQTFSSAIWNLTALIVVLIPS